MGLQSVPRLIAMSNELIRRRLIILTLSNVSHPIKCVLSVDNGLNNTHFGLVLSFTYNDPNNQTDSVDISSSVPSNLVPCYQNKYLIPKLSSHM